MSATSQLYARRELARALAARSRRYINTDSTSSGISRWFSESSFTESDYTGQVFGVLYYVSLTIFVIFLILTFVNYAIYPIFSFSPNDLALVTIPSLTDKQTAFITGPAAYNTPTTFTKIPLCSYTIGADIYLSGNFMLAQIPRVVLYRGSDAVINGGTVNNLQSTYSQSNIIVWLDPVKNDLYVSVFAQKDGTTVVLETSDPVENVPIKSVFRLAVVFSPNFLEIYINGKLERSMVIDGSIVSVNETNNFYSSVKSIQSNVMLGNLTMWPRILTSREINVYESAPKADEKFFFKTSQ